MLSCAAAQLGDGRRRGVARDEDVERVGDRAAVGLRH
jgi:hypothetical protein